MRLTTWNLLHGLAMPPQSPPALPEDLERVLDENLKKIAPDVLGLQEVDFLLERSGSENQVASIAASIGAAHWAFAPSVLGSPDENWTTVGPEHQGIVTSEDAGNLGSTHPGYGIGMVSKIPVKKWVRLELRRAPIGIMMSLPVNGKVKRVYVRDHPRSALAAILDNGWLVINTHLSFVPGFNLLQLLRIKRWVKRLPVADKKKVILMGDLNLPFQTLVKGINWNSLASQKTFPSWNPKLQIDYILSQKVASEDVSHTPSVLGGISDHLPLSIDIDTD